MAVGCGVRCLDLVRWREGTGVVLTGGLVVAPLRLLCWCGGLGL